MLRPKLQKVMNLIQEKKFGTYFGGFYAVIDKPEIEYYYSEKDMFYVKGIQIYEPEFSDAEQVESKKILPSKRRFSMNIDEDGDINNLNFYFKVPSNSPDSSEPDVTLSQKYIQKAMGFDKLIETLSGPECEELRNCGLAPEIMNITLENIYMDKNKMYKIDIYRNWIIRNMNFDYEKEFFENLKKEIGGQFYAPGRSRTYSKKLELHLDNIDDTFPFVSRQLRNINMGLGRGAKIDFLTDLLEYFKKNLENPVMKLDVNTSIKPPKSLEQIKGEITSLNMEITNIPGREDMRPQEAYVGFYIEFNPETKEFEYRPSGEHEILEEIGAIFADL